MAIFQVQVPEGLYLEGRFNRGFFALPVWGAYIKFWRDLYMEGLIFGILQYFYFLITIQHIFQNWLDGPSISLNVQFYKLRCVFKKGF